MIIWRLTDGRAGHENQTSGLVEAMQRLRSGVQCHDVPCEACLPLKDRLRAIDEAATRLAPPDLILGAGHRTHLPLLFTKKRFGGRTVVLMSPSIPHRFFDLIFLPRHDASQKHRPNCVPTIGALNRVVPSHEHRDEKGVMLIGGPSRQYGWDESNLVAQVSKIVHSAPHVTWELTTSRRTPTSCLPKLQTVTSRLEVVPCEATGPDWVPRKLGEAGHVWVTEDSVSMIFEALTAGSAVGLLDMPCQNPNHRVPQELNRLAAEGAVVRYGELGLPPCSREHAVALSEATRCARVLFNRFDEWAHRPVMPWQLTPAFS
jgi:uncharacterized protein